MNSPHKHDERPEHIHMVICGIGFLGFYVLLRALHLSHLVASIRVIVVALPLMYLLLPLTTLIYFGISKPETRRSNLHVTDAGITTLVFFIVWLLMLGVLPNKSKHQKSIHSTNSTTTR